MTSRIEDYATESVLSRAVILDVGVLLPIQVVHPLLDIGVIVQELLYGLLLMRWGIEFGESSRRMVCGKQVNKEPANQN